MIADTYRGELEKPQSLHLYAYCENNPINFMDPSGHWRIPIAHWGNFKESMNYSKRYHTITIKVTYKKGSKWLAFVGALSVSCSKEKTVSYNLNSFGKKTIRAIITVNKPKSGHTHKALVRGSGLIYKGKRGGAVYRSFMIGHWTKHFTR